MRDGTIVVMAGISLVLGFPPRTFGSPQALDPCNVEWSEAASSCSWEMVEVEAPFVLRSPEGTLVNEGGRRWPDGVDVVIELAAADDHRARHSARARVPSGKFSIKNVRDGHYCFRIGVRPAGWSCVQGRIKITRSAPLDARLDVTVPLGR